jgi:hypothetical protein
MILAAPLVIPFAEAVGLSVATLGMAKVADMVNEYIQENPEQSMKILSTIVPGVGIGEIFMKKGKDEEVEEDIEVEDVDARDLTKKEKAKKMKELAKSGASREKMIKGYEEIILPGKEDEMLDEAEDRYEGGVEEVTRPKFDYKKFFKKRYADGGSIGIEVLFEEKKPRKNFNTGGTTYDPRASAVDYATALNKVGAGTQAQKRQSLSDYLGSVLSTQGQKIGNVGTMALQGAKGVLGIQGTPITDSMQASLQNIIQKQIKDSGKLSGNINYKDYGVKTNTQGNEFLGFGDRSFTDPEAALATTLGQASYSVDPKTGKITFTGGTAYDFGDDQFGGLGKFISKGGAFNQLPSVSNKFQPGATEYNPDITLGPDFMKQFNKTPLSESDFYNQFYQMPYKGFENKYFQTLQKGDPFYDEIRRSSSAGSFSDLVDRGAIKYYTGPTDYKNYLSTFADGGRVGLFMGGDPLTGQALAIYNSMNAYGFSDQEIANALEGQGLYTAPGSSTPETTAPNIINQQIQSGGGGGGITTLDPLTRPQGTPFNLNSLTKTKFGYNNALGKTIEGVKDFTGSMIDKFSGSKVGEGATKFKNFAITPMMALMQKRNPLNPGASNYNPNLQKQMDFLEGQTGTKITGTSGNLKFTDDQMMIGRDPNSGLAKYGPGSVLEGQNVVSGFGTNDYEEQLGNYIERMRNRAITKTLSKFQQAKLDAAIAEMGREMERQQREVAERARAANPDVYARADELGFTDGKGGGFASKSTGTNEAFSNKTGRGRTGYGDGGLATMFKEKR